MYLRGRLTLDLSGTLVELRPPSHFFAGVANLLTKGSWDTKEELETYKLMAFAQSTNRALSQMGVEDVIRFSLAGEVIYEDRQDQPNDFALAMQALQQRVEQGFEPDPHSEFDMVLKHDDGVLNYVIDLDFIREHKPGVHPVTIQVTAIPSVLRRLSDEDDRAFRDRMDSVFVGPVPFDERVDQWEAQLEGFLNQIADHFRTALLLDNYQVETRRFLPRRRDAQYVDQYAGWGYPLYGYDPFYDLAYLTLWDSLWMNYQFRMRDFYYGDPGWNYVYVGDNGMGWNDYQQWDNSSNFASVPNTGGDWAPAASDSGGGGWLSNIGGFSGGDSSGGGSSWGSDSGGGGDISSGSSCNSGSSGSSCSSASSCSSGSSCGSSCGGGGCGSS